jgi:hypothetical protein
MAWTKTHSNRGQAGIRDAEWIVQQLQMMIGPTQPPARAKSTLRALQILDDMDALSPDETLVLREGYLWLRVAEHRCNCGAKNRFAFCQPKPKRKRPWRGDWAVVARRGGGALAR